jgi:hypothetical protein
MKPKPWLCLNLICDILWQLATDSEPLEERTINPG